MIANKQINRLGFFCVILLLSIFPVFAVGVVDTAFGTNGKTAARRFENYYPVFEMLPNDKFIVHDVRELFRYMPDGKLDESFGAGGIVALTALGATGISSVAPLPDGKMLVGGSVLVPNSNPQNYNYWLTRLNVDGTIDRSFAANGISTFDIGSPNEWLTNMQIQPDGKILARSGAAPSDPLGLLSIVRLNADGTPDRSFGTSGVVYIQADRSFRNLEAIDFDAAPDNKVVIAYSLYRDIELYELTTVRLTSDGSFDPTFGNGGKVVIRPASSANSLNVEVQPDGKTLLLLPFGLAQRLLPNGSLDPTFKSGRIRSVDFLKNGRLLVANGSDFITITDGNNNPISRIRNPETTRVFQRIEIRGAKAQSDGKIVVFYWDGETANKAPSGPPVFYFIRYKSFTSLATRIQDYNGDEKTDIVVYRPSFNSFFSDTNSSFGGTRQQLILSPPFAGAVPEDFHGDYRSDAIYTSFSQGYSYFCGFSPAPVPYCYQWGLTTDVKLGGDYDGDNKSDLTIFRDGLWHVRRTANGESMYYSWGQAGDKPVPADYDFDGKTDAAIFRPSTGVWWVLRSSDNTYTAVQFGVAEDKPVPGDYDADGRADFAVYRPSNGVWYLLKSTEGFAAAQFGSAADKPVPGDYDGDGRTDIAVYRSSNHVWYLLQSNHGFSYVIFGQSGDIPITTAYAAE